MRKVLTHYLRPENITLEVKSESKKQIIKDLLSLLVKTGEVSPNNFDELYQGLLEREKLESTAIGGGLAIPHVRSDLVDDIKMTIAISKEGIDFDAIDGNPVHFIVLIISPFAKANEYIAIIARFSRMVRNKKVVQKLLNCNSNQEAYQIITKFDSGEM